MRRVWNPWTRSWPALVAGLLVAVAGCKPGAPLTLVPLSGRVLVNGKPAGAPLDVTALAEDARGYVEKYPHKLRVE